MQPAVGQAVAAFAMSPCPLADSRVAPLRLGVVAAQAGGRHRERQAVVRREGRGKESVNVVRPSFRRQSSPVESLAFGLSEISIKIFWFCFSNFDFKIYYLIIIKNLDT